MIPALDKRLPRRRTCLGGSGFDFQEFVSVTSAVMSFIRAPYGRGRAPARTALLGWLSGAVRATFAPSLVGYRWLAMLDLLRDHPMTAHANRLTDQDFADVIANMTEKRGDKTERLIRLLILENGNRHGRNTSVGPDPDRYAAGGSPARRTDDHQYRRSRHHVEAHPRPGGDRVDDDPRPRTRRRPQPRPPAGPDVCGPSSQLRRHVAAALHGRLFPERKRSPVSQGYQARFPGWSIVAGRLMPIVAVPEPCQTCWTTLGTHGDCQSQLDRGGM